MRLILLWLHVLVTRGNTKGNMKLSTKRIVSFYLPIRRMIEKSGYDVVQAELACQSAANDVTGKEKDPKIGDVKKAKQGKEVAWKEQTTVEFSGVTCTPLDFLAWHDSLKTHFDSHGAPKGELEIGVMPEILAFWLDTMKSRKSAKAAQDKAEGKAALEATREQVKNGPARGTKPELVTKA